MKMKFHCSLHDVNWGVLWGSEMCLLVNAKHQWDSKTTNQMWVLRDPTGEKSCIILRTPSDTIISTAETTYNNLQHSFKRPTFFIHLLLYSTFSTSVSLSINPPTHMFFLLSTLWVTPQYFKTNLLKPLKRIDFYLLHLLLHPAIMAA